jgi:hypothetical protein
VPFISFAAVVVGTCGIVVVKNDIGIVTVVSLSVTYVVGGLIVYTGLLVPIGPITVSNGCLVEVVVVVAACSACGVVVVGAIVLVGSSIPSVGSVVGGDMVIIVLIVPIGATNVVEGGLVVVVVAAGMVGGVVVAGACVLVGSSGATVASVVGGLIVYTGLMVPPIGVPVPNTAAKAPAASRIATPANEPNNLILCIIPLYYYRISEP